MESARPVDVVQSTRRMSMERRASLDARRAATSAARGMASAKKAAAHNKARSTTAMANHSSASSIKHRSGVTAVQRPTVPGATRQEEHDEPAPEPAAAAPPAPKRGPTTFAPFNLSSSNRVNRASVEAAEASKPVWDSSVGPTDPVRRHAPKLDAPKSVTKSREERREFAKSASKAARSEAMASRRFA